MEQPTLPKPMRLGLEKLKSQTQPWQWSKEKQSPEAMRAWIKKLLIEKPHLKEFLSRGRVR